MAHASQFRRLLWMLVSFLVVALLAASCARDATTEESSTDSTTSTTTEGGADNGVGSRSTTTQTAGDAAKVKPSNDTGKSPSTARRSDSTSPSPGPAGRDDWDVESIDWHRCGSLSCGTVTVPIDYEDPSQGTLDIAVNKADAQGRNPIGVLFVNPGGPGASGVDFVAESVAAYFPPELLDRFDIVGWDPRGVGESEPTIECGDDGELFDELADLRGPQYSAQEIELGEEAVELCADSMGAAAGALDSYHVAMDMDVIREALGYDQISYLGFSYGSTLGVWYATLFPDRVRAMVLDGADNPQDDLSTYEAREASMLEEMSGFETQLAEALKSCDSPDCPLYNDGDPVSAYKEAAAKLDVLVPLAGGNPDAPVFAVVTGLYSETDWPLLMDGLAALRDDGDTDILMDLIEFQIDTDGGINETEYINCLDGWVLYPELDRESQFDDEERLVATLRRELPLLSAAMDLEAVYACPFMDTLHPRPFTGPLDGGDVPILVIGNPSDPATPFVESKQLVDDVLSNGTLLEVDHFQHTVYPLNECVVKRVHEVLIDGDVPEGGVEHCDRDDSYLSGDEDLVGLITSDCEYIVQELELDEDSAFCERVAQEMFDTVQDPSWSAEAERADDPSDFYYQTLLDVMGVG